MLNDTLSADILNGKKIEYELALMGENCVYISTVESPSAVIHNFSVNSLSALLKIKRFIPAFELKYRTAVYFGAPCGLNSLSADFSLSFDKLHTNNILWQNYRKEIVKPFDFLIGIDTANNIVKANLEELPHLLIAGETGGGKSVTLNTIIQSLTSAEGVTPDNLRFVLIDTKRTELSAYSESHYLAAPICTNYKAAFFALKWLNSEMMERYSKMQADGLKTGNFIRIAVVIDELADLMLENKKIIEPLIVRLAQLGRAANIHLIVATQRPTVDVCTGHIKANIPSRIALQVASVRDSINILDRKGAERLKGKGDAILKLSTENATRRLQCFNYVNTDGYFIAKTE